MPPLDIVENKLLNRRCLNDWWKDSFSVLKMSLKFSVIGKAIPPREGVPTELVTNLVPCPKALSVFPVSLTILLGKPKFDKKNPIL